MTPEAQRIAIAEACGWTGIIVSYSGALMGFAPFNPEYDEQQWQAVPNYPEDLNAMHEAEKVISEKGESLRRCYMDNLCVSANGPLSEMDGSYQEIWAMCHATAAQRAEAFLRTIGKWKD